MSRTSNRVAKLIEEMDELEMLASEVQADSPQTGNRPDDDQVRLLRERYLRWHASCQPFFNDAGKSAFNSHYYGAPYSIHEFLASPGKVTTTRTPQNQYPARTYNVWQYPRTKYFSDPLDEQRLLLMRVRATLEERESQPRETPPPAIDTIRLHSRVHDVSSKLFKDGHYRQAIFQACLAFNQAVQERSGRSDLDGTRLMQQAFSVNSPLLKFDGHPDEQQGYMWLFSGVSMAVRNPRAHRVGETKDLDANEALELLAVVSACFRALDRANKV